MSLDTVFDELDVIADPFALCELQGRCTLGLDSQAAATLHYILAGEGELLLPGLAPIRLGPGTLALVPTMQPHRLRSFGAPGHPIPECHPAELDLASHLIVGEQRHDTERLLAICSRLKVGHSRDGRADQPGARASGSANLRAVDAVSDAGHSARNLISEAGQQGDDPGFAAAVRHRTASGAAPRPGQPAELAGGCVGRAAVASPSANVGNGPEILTRSKASPPCPA